MEVLCAGSFMIDIVAALLPDITPPGGLSYAPKGISLNVGGHAANTSIDLTQIGQTGVTATGCIGDDHLGGYIEKTLRGAGVDPRPLILEKASTAKNIALTVVGEDRRFIAEFAANTLLSPEHVIHLIREKPRLLYLGTIGGLKYVDKNLETILKKAKDIGSATLVDVIPPTQSNWTHVKQALKYIDILHCNEYEAQLFTGESNSQEAAFKLRKLGARNVIVSLKEKGLTAITLGISITMPAFKVREVDATGAGDALCAGVIRSLLTKDPIDISEKDFVTALLHGQAAGAACVTATGATRGVTKENVDRLIEDQGEAVLGASTLLRL